MKPNKPNVGSEKKTFAKLNGLTIVGNYVTQNPDAITSNLLDDSYIRKIANKVFESTTPSLIKGDTGEKGEKGDKGDNGIADARIITITVCTSSGPEEIDVYAPE